jgi:hypothetical protein
MSIFIDMNRLNTTIFTHTTRIINIRTHRVTQRTSLIHIRTGMSSWSTPTRIIRIFITATAILRRRASMHMLH